jgi:hypothetical protein
MAFVSGVLPLSAAGTRAEFESRVSDTMTKLNREAGTSDGTVLVGELIQREYNVPIEELKWGLENNLSWGEMAIFAYIRATTGQTFLQLDLAAAERDLWGYAETAGMNTDKMANSLGQFLKRVESERNTRIFERMRSSRRVTRMPDLGSGFGLLQETLDFRRLESPRPIKDHTLNPGGLSKGGQ